MRCWHGDKFQPSAHIIRLVKTSIMSAAIVLLRMYNTYSLRIKHPCLLRGDNVLAKYSCMLHIEVELSKIKKFIAIIFITVMAKNILCTT